ncbi:hypothetical protein ACLOJK_028055 [Asimina triloba]
MRCHCCIMSEFNSNRNLCRSIHDAVRRTQQSPQSLAAALVSGSSGAAKLVIIASLTLGHGWARLSLQQWSSQACCAMGMLIYLTSRKETDQIEEGHGTGPKLQDQLPDLYL